MPTCSACGGGKGKLLYTCNYCGLKHCSDHRLPEKHACVPTESGSGGGGNSRWFSEKLKRSNLRKNVSRSSDIRSHKSGTSSNYSPKPTSTKSYDGSGLNPGEFILLLMCVVLMVVSAYAIYSGL